MNTKRPIDRYYAKTLNDINENFTATAKEDKVHFPGIGHFLRAKRCDCLMQQKYVEEMTGINRSGISKYENAQQIPAKKHGRSIIVAFKDIVMALPRGHSFRMKRLCSFFMLPTL